MEDRFLYYYCTRKYSYRVNQCVCKTTRAFHQYHLTESPIISIAYDVISVVYSVNQLDKSLCLLSNFIQIRLQQFCKYFSIMLCSLLLTLSLSSLRYGM